MDHEQNGRDLFQVHEKNGESRSYLKIENAPCGVENDFAYGNLWRQAVSSQPGTNQPIRFAFFPSFSSVWYDVNQEHSSSISLYFQFNRTFSRMCFIPFKKNIVPPTQGSNVKQSGRCPEDEEEVEVVVVVVGCCFL